MYSMYSLKALSILIHQKGKTAPASSPLGASRSMQAPRDLFSLKQGCHIIIAVAFGIQWNKITKADKPVLLLMAEILHQLIGSLSHYLQGFIHPWWCRILSINSITVQNPFVYLHRNLIPNIFGCLPPPLDSTFDKKSAKRKKRNMESPEVAPMAAPKLQSEVTKLQNFVSVTNG